MSSVPCSNWIRYGVHLHRDSRHSTQNHFTPGRRSTVILVRQRMGRGAQTNSGRCPPPVAPLLATPPASRVGNDLTA